MSGNASFGSTHTLPRSANRWLIVWMLAMLLALLLVIGLSMGVNVASAQGSTIDVQGTWQVYFGDNGPYTATLRQSGTHINGEIRDIDQTKLGLLDGDMSSDGAINLNVLWYKAGLGAEIPLLAFKQAAAERGDPSQQTVRSTMTVRPNAAGDELTGTYVYLKIRSDPASGEYKGIDAVPDQPIRFKRVPEELPWILIIGATGVAALGAAVTADQIRKRKYWIKIYLVDQAGHAVANQPFQIKAPDGKIILTGILNIDGMAYARGSKGGEYEVSFPDLDASEWGPLIEPGSPESLT